MATDLEKSKETTRPLHIGKPDWLKTSIPAGGPYLEIKKELQQRNLFTVCQEAKCPNMAECWAGGTATFMVLGGTCTRACRFCNVATGNPEGALNPHEPAQVAETAKLMKLKYAVITMVDRDDLPDGGAAHVARVVEEVRRQNSGIVIELLAGDFSGKEASLSIILAARPEVFAHNVETVERLTPRVRDRRASYRQSLEVLGWFREAAPYPVRTKSAVMLGLGEERDEVVRTFADLREVGVDYLTIGQYMRPTKKHLSVKRWVHPDEFKDLGDAARAMGFASVASGPLVRSSYRAHEFHKPAPAKTPSP